MTTVTVELQEDGSFILPPVIKERLTGLKMFELVEIEGTLRLRPQRNSTQSQSLADDLPYLQSDDLLAGTYAAQQTRHGLLEGQGLAAIVSAMADVISQRLPRLAPNERTALLQFALWLHHHYGNDLLRVALFGSKARGDFDAESDLDVLVILRTSDYWQCWREITDLTSRLLLASGVNISALVRDEATYQWWLAHHAPIYNSLQQDGVDLWTRDSETSSPFALPSATRT